MSTLDKHNDKHSSLPTSRRSSSSNFPRFKLSITTNDDINLESIDPGTIRIDCSGAFIANDDLLRNEDDEYEEDFDSNSNSTSSTTTPPSSNTSSDLDEELDDSDTSTIKNGESMNIITKNNITLPQHNDEIIHISVDIGGTLTKLVFFKKAKTTKGNKYEGGGKLYFQDFQTENFKNEAMKYMIKLISKSIDKKNTNSPPITYIMATGGGAHKFYNLMKKTFKKHKLPMKIIAKDEMACLIKGLDWLITKIPQEIFTYDLVDLTTHFEPLQLETEIYPYLLVNIGSGVSMVKVTKPGPDGFERIGGSSLGGGTLWGLLSLLTDAKDYNEMLEMASRGDNENIDLLVGDIYGTNYNKIGLKANHIASSFAKVFKKLRYNNNTDKPMTSAEKLAQFKQEDIARSLLFSISNNIGQIAYLHALRFNLKRIYFGGSYISGHMQTIHTLSYAVNFWSKGDMQSYFLRHEGYLGSVGAFMMGPAVDQEQVRNGHK
ncbi:SPBC4B4.01c Pantothenate kinase [Candida maltosa Xu316]